MLLVFRKIIFHVTIDMAYSAHRSSLQLFDTISLSGVANYCCDGHKRRHNVITLQNNEYLTTQAHTCTPEMTSANYNS